MKKIIVGLLSAILLALPLFAFSAKADTSYVTATVTGYCSQTLSSGYQNNVTFGSVAQGTTNNPATSNGDGNATNSSYKITTSSNTNCNVTWGATDFTGAGTITKSNFKMNVTKFADGYAGNGSTVFTSDITKGTLSTGSELYSNFFLTVPALQAKGAYTSTMTISIAES